MIEQELSTGIINRNYQQELSTAIIRIGRFYTQLHKFGLLLTFFTQNRSFLITQFKILNKVAQFSQLELQN
jgi:hypothetical protein